MRAFSFSRRHCSLFECRKARIENGAMRRSKQGLKRPVLVAIVGGSGSGKSWLARRLKKILGARALHLAFDDFYRDLSDLPAARRARVNFDHPSAIDWKCFQKALTLLSRGHSALCPRYDFPTHCRRGRARTVKPRPVILVEGLWLLRPAPLRRLFKLRIFLDCREETRLSRRLRRDLRTRGRDERSVRGQFRAMVQPMHSRFVQPQAKWADVVFKEPLGIRGVQDLARRIQSLAKRVA
jgi:uridine kinase